jgi:predicted nuclease of predicted toxin-antitoxin system
MKFITDHCTDARVQKALRAADRDCVRWDRNGRDPQAADPIIAATADHMGRIVISINWDFLYFRQRQKPQWGFHVHVVGRQGEFVDLIERRLRDLEAKIQACGEGIYIVNDDAPIVFDKAGKYSRRGAAKERREWAQRPQGDTES